MRPLSIYLFGTFQVQAYNQEVAEFDSRKVQELFSYLLLYPYVIHEREHLAALLWPNTTTGQSKAYLRKALWQLQRALSAVEHSALLTVTSRSVYFASSPELWVDVAVFERVRQQYVIVVATTPVGIMMQTLHDAVTLYRDDLLQGWEAEWCVSIRDRFRQDLLVLLSHLLESCLQEGRYIEACQYGEQLLHYEPACETTHRRLMTSRYLQGDRTGALRQYQRCVRALEHEFGALPTAATTQLYDQLRTNQMDLGGALPHPDSRSLHPVADAGEAQMYRLGIPAPPGRIRARIP